MAELAKEEINQLTKQLQGQWDEMDHIIESNKEEEKAVRVPKYAGVVEMRQLCLVRTGKYVC